MCYESGDISVDSFTLYDNICIIIDQIRGINMPRIPRHMTLAEINHIMLRGVGHMDLFFEDGDYRRFLLTLKRISDGSSIRIYAYCLMNNHVHLLVHSEPDMLPDFMKRLEISYAAYFNGVHEHSGHLFQNRYKSEPVTTDGYFLNALRYILRNPQAADICSWEKYRWSSADSYVNGIDDGITETSLGLEMLGGVEGFIQFVCDENDAAEFKLSEPVNGRRLTSDEKALSVFRDITGLNDPLVIRTMQRSERNEILLRMKQAGLTIRQIERMTGINRNIIQRVK